MKVLYKFAGLFSMVILISVSSSAQTNHQSTGSGKEIWEKKKGGFFKDLKDAFADDLKYGSKPGPSRQNNKSGIPFSGKHTISGEWTEYGAFGSNGMAMDFNMPSPRNHMYYFVNH